MPEGFCRSQGAKCPLFFAGTLRFFAVADNSRGVEPLGIAKTPASWFWLGAGPIGRPPEALPETHRHRLGHEGPFVG